MNAALQQFQNNIARIRNLHALSLALKNMTTQVIDVDDIYRAEIIMVVSALDTYVHEIVRLGMYECFTGNRTRPTAFNQFRISLDTSQQLLITSQFDALELEIRDQHGWKSFQKSGKISEAIKLISHIVLWDVVSLRLNIPANTIKTQLDLIIDRRNKIAHEADTDPTYGTLWPINATLVEGSTDFISDVVEAIHLSII